MVQIFHARPIKQSLKNCMIGGQHGQTSEENFKSEDEIRADKLTQSLGLSATTKKKISCVSSCPFSSEIVPTKDVVFNNAIESNFCQLPNL